MPKIDQICNSLNCISILSFIDNCITIKLREKIKTQLCLSDVFSPVDGYSRLSEKIEGGSILELFHNNLNVSPLPNKQQTRGVFFIIQYPTEDIYGEPLEDSLKSVFVVITNKAGDSIRIPVYNFYSLINNPVTTNTDFLIESMSIENHMDVPVTVEALMVTTNKDGVNTDPSSCA